MAWKAVLAGLAVLVLGAPPAWAQAGEWPNRPVRVILPGGPGAAFDIIGRIIIDGLNPTLGHRLVADNRGGAGGQIAAEAAARAAPDGYTLFMGLLSTQVVIPAVQPVAYDPVASFVPVALTTLSPMVLVVNPAVPARTLQEFIALTKSRPEALNFSMAGRTALPHMLMALLARQTGMRVYPVPYSSSATALQAVVSGDVQASFEVSSIVRPQAMGGALRALAMTSAARDPGMPDVPTMAEAGVPDFVAGSWTALFMPAGSPPAVVARLNGLLQALAADAGYRARMAGIGAQAQTGTPADLTAWVAAEHARWHDLAKELGGVK